MNFIESAKRIRPTLDGLKPAESRRDRALIRKVSSFGIAGGLIILEKSIETGNIGQTILSGLVAASSTMEAVINIRK